MDDCESCPQSSCSSEVSLSHYQIPPVQPDPPSSLFIPTHSRINSRRAAHKHTLSCLSLPPACVISRADVWSPVPCKWIPVRPGRRTWPHKNQPGNMFQTSSCGPGGGHKVAAGRYVGTQRDIRNIFFMIWIAFYGVFLTNGTLASWLKTSICL